ncbi:MAG: ribonuclease T2-like [Candelina mexicana]|nr:MAG: ribonuclease T2-like [Candelina mexicana]
MPSSAEVVSANGIQNGTWSPSFNTYFPSYILESLQPSNVMSSLSFSIRTVYKVILGTAQIALHTNIAAAGTPASCPNPGLSCSTAPAGVDTCCFNTPGGQLLQTQFWDTNPPTGPSNSWTVHGLWPDHCDGTYDANCDPARAYTNISEIIQAAGQQSLLDYMNTYWKDYQGNDETFWEHEWAKHGTCVSTLEPDCYTNYVPQQEVVDYFQKTVDLFQGLDTYSILAAAGITPSTSRTYTSAQIESAISSVQGHQVTIGCSSGALNEIWYHFNVRGSVQTGTFVATDPDGTKSTCPATGVKYLPKGTTQPASTTTSAGPAPTGSFSGKGYLNVVSGGATKGCIISGGTWYTSGTCATFTATATGAVLPSSGDTMDGKLMNPASGFTLTSSKGKCAISNGALTCASTVTTATVFTSAGANLAYNGATNFYADSVPSGSTQATIYSTSHPTAVTITWQSV